MSQLFPLCGMRRNTPTDDFVSHTEFMWMLGLRLSVSRFTSLEHTAKTKGIPSIKWCIRCFVATTGFVIVHSTNAVNCCYIYAWIVWTDSSGAVQSCLYFWRAAQQALSAIETLCCIPQVTRSDGKIKRIVENLEDWWNIGCLWCNYYCSRWYCNVTWTA